MHVLETDYLVVGSGAMGMAFADTLLAETDADMIIIDRHAKPGGHWNVAYPFVHLHQPSSYFGVSSKELSRGEVVRTGMNEGLGDVASGQEVAAYFDDIMQQHLLPSGRVRYFPMSDYEGDGAFVSTVSGLRQTVRYKKLVNATRLTVDVPAMHTPAFSVAPDVQFVPLNDLPRITRPPESYTVVGAGKTGIDACLWLLQRGVAPDKIRWIMPRDAWMLPRENAQTLPHFFERVFANQASMMESIATADSIQDMTHKLETSGYFVRLDPHVEPTMFHAATVSARELDALRQIENVIRMGRVQAIESDHIRLDGGEIPTSPNILHVDCSASLTRRKHEFTHEPVFNGNVITPQTVRPYMPVFSGALVAYVEANYTDETQKNQLTGVVPLPDTIDDFVRMTYAGMTNQLTWSGDQPLRRWIRNNRLDGFGKLAQNVDPEDHDKIAILKKIRDHAPAAFMKLQEFMAALDG